MALIKINLAPIEELENRYWWVPDAIVLAVTTALALSFVDYSISDIENEIAAAETSAQNYRNQYQDVRAQIQSYETAKKREVELTTVYQSLTKITESQLTKFIPVILLEHIQNLKPEGVWLREVRFRQKGLTEDQNANAQGQQAQNNQFQNQDPPRNEIVLQGRALDNVILAEFVTQLKSTQLQEADPTDLRTQAFFNMIGIGVASRITEQPLSQNEPGLSVMEFELVVSFDERPVNPAVNKEIARILDELKRKRK